MKGWGRGRRSSLSMHSEGHCGLWLQQPEGHGGWEQEALQSHRAIRPRDGELRSKHTPGPICLLVSIGDSQPWLTSPKQLLEPPALWTGSCLVSPKKMRPHTMALKKKSQSRMGAWTAVTARSLQQERATDLGSIWVVGEDHCSSTHTSFHGRYQAWALLPLE